MRTFLLLLPLGGCAFGLETQVVGTSPADAAEGVLPRTEVGLEGNLYSMSAHDMHVTQPPGLDALWDRVLTTPLLVYIEEESDSELRLATALSGADGNQDPCEKVRRFPVADWRENPLFAAGPGSFDASFGGSAATVREVELSGVIDAQGLGWSDGTLDAVLDTRELAAALGGIDDVCALVQDLGGECFACADGEEACFSLAIESVRAKLIEADFDVTPDCGA